MLPAVDIRFAVGILFSIKHLLLQIRVKQAGGDSCCCQTVYVYSFYFNIGFMNHSILV